MEIRYADYGFNLNDESLLLVYPASTVKLPVAILAWNGLEEQNIPGLE